MVQDLLTFLRPASPSSKQKCKSFQPPTRHASVVSNPTITAITQPLPIRRSGTEIPCTVHASTQRTFCGVSLSPSKRHSENDKMKTILLDRPSTPTPIPDPFKSLRQQQACNPKDVSDKRSSITSLSTMSSQSSTIDIDTASKTTSSTADNESDACCDIVRTRDSEIHHIAQIRASRASRGGHWLKLAPVTLSPRERLHFNRLRSAQERPVLKSQIRPVDEKHRPMHLSRKVVEDEEYWDLDPFDDTVYIVEWVPDANLQNQEQGRRQQQQEKKRRPWSMYSKQERSDSSLSCHLVQEINSRTIGASEISTIRVVI